MPENRAVPSALALTSIQPERAEEFEAFVRDVVVPAVRQARPQAEGLWELWRPTAESSQVVNSPRVAPAPPSTYAFVFFGDLPLDDWDLVPVFTEVHGEDRGGDLNRQFEDFIVGDQQIHQFSGPV